jgi:hypothetical protein
MSLLLDETQTRRATLAKITDRAPEQVRTYQLELDVLREQGLLIDLNISGTTMFERKAEWDEIGFQPGGVDVRKQRISTGRKIILPVDDEIKELHSISATLRQTLAKYSCDIPGFFPYKFVTLEAFAQKFKPKFDECLVRWRHTIDTIITSIEGWRDQLAEKSALEAEQSWKSITGQSYEFVIIDEKPYDHDAYIDYCVSRDLDGLPTPELVEATLKLDYVVGMVYGEADAAADHARAEVIRQQLQVEREHSNLENAILQEQVRHDRYIHNLAEDERRARREEILKAEAEHIRRQLAEHGSPFDKIVRDARARAADSAAEILQSVKKNGFVRGKVAEKGAGLREYFQLMAVHDDKYLLDLLSALERQIGPVGDRSKETPERDLATITATLEQIVDLADTEFQVITSGPGRFSALEL